MFFYLLFDRWEVQMGMYGSFGFVLRQPPLRVIVITPSSSTTEPVHILWLDIYFFHKTKSSFFIIIINHLFFNVRVNMMWWYSTAIRAHKTGKCIFFLFSRISIMMLMAIRNIYRCWFCCVMANHFLRIRVMISSIVNYGTPTRERERERDRRRLLSAFWEE